MAKSPKTPRRDPIHDFLSEYTAGLDQRDLRRLFERDLTRAYSVLTRDQADAGRVPSGARGIFQRAKLLFLGVSYQLSPPRRLVFGLSILAALVSLVASDFQFSTERIRIAIDSSPLLLGASFAGFVYVLVVEMVDRVLVRDELQVARQLQRELLPSHDPDLAGWEFASSYRPAHEIGGDYFNFLPLADGRLAIAIADASGHGMAAGLLMAIANASLHTALDLDPAPERVIELLNRMLCRTGDRRAFLTVFYALLEPATGHLTYACAGHPFPLLRRADGSIEELGTGSLPLGIHQPLRVPVAETTLLPGDRLLLCTDGLPEALPQENGTAFGFDRLRTLLEVGGEPAAIHGRILAALEKHLAGDPIHDDVTLVVIGRRAQPTSIQ
jgi:phosphoserine phosphatase RsbU/P